MWKWVACLFATSCGFAAHLDEPPGPDAVSAVVEQVDPPSGVVCPASYEVRATGVYRFVTTKASWEAARGDCADDGDATHLVVLGTEDERVAVNAAYPAAIWLGLSDRVTTGDYRWVTAESTVPFPPQVKPWKDGEPNDGAAGSEDCIEMESGGAWDDVPCTGDTRQYVCECDGFTEVRTQSDPQS